MWTVLIVEDEVFVRESVREIIDWEEMGFTVMGEAGDGAEAFAQIRREAPDLVLSDIVMPNMDGIELLRRTREAGYGCKFVMLTCMGEFEYVRQAMEYGASNYILKLSMSVKTLRETLAKISVELGRSAVAGSESETAASLVEQGGVASESGSERRVSGAASAPAWLHEVWRMANGLADPWNAEQLALKLGAYADCRLRMGSVLHGAEEFGEEQFRRLQMIELGAEDELQIYAGGGQTTFFCWLNGSESGKLHAAPVQPPYPMVFSPLLRPGLLLEGWKRVLDELGKFWYGAAASVRVCEMEGEVPAYQDITWEKEKDLLQAFEQGKLESCRKHIDHIWQQMRQSVLPIAAVKETAIRILTTCLRIADAHWRNSADVERCASHAELKAFALRCLEDAMTTWMNKQSMTTDHPEVNKIILYIHEHYDKDITVKSLAKHVSMGENYISGLFRKKTGLTIIYYLHKVRIERAMELLRDTRGPVREIGLAVGFINDNYFIKIFKRFTGHTPSDYRRQLQEEPLP